VSTGWPFGALRPSKYGVILMDAAWLFEVWSAKGEGKSASRHYRCMTMAELKTLPVRHLAAPDCALVMWGVWSMLPQALDLMKAYGFTYKTGGAWAKRSPTGRKWAFGPGYIFRSAMLPRAALHPTPGAPAHGQVWPSPRFPASRSSTGRSASRSASRGASAT
jgi:hypothetical protein